MLFRFPLMAAGVLAGATLLGATTYGSASTFVYVSNAKDGTISSYRLDREAGQLTPLATTPAGNQVMPLAISPNKRHLYASIRSQPYYVVTYSISPGNGTLARQGRGALPASMANIDTDRSGRYLLAAAYKGDVVSVSRINDMGIAEDVQQVVATGSHAHAIHTSPDNHYAFASNLGDDQIAQFRFNPNNGRLVRNAPAVVKTPGATGPRHFVFSPNGKFVYVLGEFSGAVTTYTYDAKSGTLVRHSTAQGIPKSLGLKHGMAREAIPANYHTPRIWAADIHVTPDGRFVYISERTSSVISTFKADPDTGKLSYLRDTAVEKQPRSFQIDNSGRFMVVAGEKDNQLGLYRIVADSGKLIRLDGAPVGRDANWVEIVSF